MVSDERLRELEERYEGYSVVDNSGDKIGKVDDLFVDDVDNEEYIGVKMGLFGLSGTTLIPMELCQADEAGRRIQVNDTKEHVKEAPNFRDDDDITTEYEARIREHFGLSGSGQAADTGNYGSYGGADNGGAAGVGAAGAAGAAGMGSRDDDRDDQASGTSGADQGTPVTGPVPVDRGVTRGSEAEREPGDTPSTAASSDVTGLGGGAQVGASPGSTGTSGSSGGTATGGTAGAAPGFDDEGNDRNRQIGQDPDTGGFGQGSARGEGTGGLSGGGQQRGDYDRGYDEGYRRAQEELRSQQSGFGGSGGTEGQTGGDAGGYEEQRSTAASGMAGTEGGEGSRPRVRRIRRLV